MPSSNIRSYTGVYCISHQVYCRGHAVLQEPLLGVLYLQSSILHILSCSSGASLVCPAFASRWTVFTIKCTAEAIVYIKSLTWVYCIYHQVYCICHYLTSGAILGCTPLAIKCTAEALLSFMNPTRVYYICHQVYCRDNHIQYIRSLTWVYCISYHVNQEPHLVSCICQQVYCICHHVHQEPHLGVLHLPSNVLHMPSSDIRSRTGVYYINIQVYCGGHAVLQEPHLAEPHIFAIKCTAYPIIMAVATTEADDCLVCFCPDHGYTSPKAVDRGHFGHFWSLRLV